MVKPAMDANTVYQTLRNGPPEARRALLEGLPNGVGRSATPLLASDQPGMAVLAFLSPVMPLCAGMDPATGAVLASGTHRYAVELFERSSDHAGMMPMTLSNLATQYANACNLVGNSAAVLAFTEQWIPYYTKLGENQNLPALKAARINALLNERRLDDAQHALEDPTLRGNPATDIEVARLEKKLQRLRGDITDDRNEAAADQAAADAVGLATPEVKRALAEMIGQTTDDSAGQRALQDAVKRLLDNAAPTDLTDPAAFDKALEGLGAAERILTGGAGGDNELTIRRRVREASGIFVGGRRPAPEQIRRSLADLEACLAWARAQHHTELTRDALWGMYICRGRLSQPSEAADALLALRADIEHDRASIADPLKRGGVFSTYPHLFSALCEKLQLAGRTEELLEAIEASKGRGVADILTRKAGRPVEDASIYSAVQRLPDLTRRHAFHYMTFHVDDERTYIALVSKTGEIHAIPPVAVGRAAIRDASLHADPRQGNAAVALAPLADLIDSLRQEGVIARGDHICYAPDEDLSNVPLHYLTVNRKPLIDFVSLSRIHNAAHLEYVLGRSVTLPTRYVALVVPLVQNTTSTSWPEMNGYLHEPVKQLDVQCKGEVLEQRQATLEGLRAAELRGKVLHFSAHGMFPELDAEGTPFEDSGIVLAPQNGLPDGDRLGAGDLEGVLTPSTVLDFALDLAGSHVSIMSCVSGLSREGLGGDALGIEWAFTQAGATSQLTSHWNVSAKVAAPLFQRFYQLWLGNRLSRARALVQVMTEFRSGEDQFKKPESWAAFSLTGDWR